MTPRAFFGPALIGALALAAFAQTTPQITSRLGLKFTSEPDRKGAVAAAHKNLAANPKSADLLLKLAQAQVSVWQDREAVETLTRALAASPENGVLLTERGHRYLPLREFTKARNDLTRVVTADPKNETAYYHLGLAHYFSGEFLPAADAFRHAVATAPNDDEIIESTNWLYASLRRAGRNEEATAALEAVPPAMTSKDPHMKFYLNLVRFFQRRMSEADALPPEPPAGSTDHEAEMSFDTVAYGIGNWYLCNGNQEKAKDYRRRVLKGRVWITWGFIASEMDTSRTPVTSEK